MEKVCCCFLFPPQLERGEMEVERFLHPFGKIRELTMPSCQCIYHAAHLTTLLHWFMSLSIHSFFNMPEDDINASLSRLLLLFLYGKVLFLLESNDEPFISLRNYQHAFCFPCS